MKSTLASLILFLFVAQAGAQVNGIYNPPNVIPPTPDAASIFKVQDIPVDTRKGVANINIPIYTIKDGRIEVPISLSYSTQGVKVQDISSMIGLEWNLDFGGVITRQGEDINMAENRVQFETDNTAAKIQADQNYTLAYQLAGGTAEKEQPEFAFHFGKYSGSFFYDVNNTLYIKSGDPNLKIQLLNYGDQAYRADYASGFLITTDEGIQYTFANAEYTLGVAEHVSDFLITSIYDPNTNKTVSFRYDSIPAYIDNINQENIENYLYGSNPGGGPPVSWQYVTQSYNQITHYGFQIDSIIFSTGYVTFQSSNARKDGSKVLINQVNVDNLNGQQVRTMKLFQDYFVDTHSLISGEPEPDTTYKYRLRLDSLGFYDANGNMIERYAFTYNMTNCLPAYKYTVPITVAGSGTNYTDCTGVDIWGYYNGKLSNQGLVPSNVIPTYDRDNYVTNPLFEGNRSVDTVFNQTGVLTKIKFPSGGSAVFSYQTNQFDSGSTGTYGQYFGGLRVKNISFYDNDSAISPVLQKNYHYQYAIQPGIPASANLFTYVKVKNFTAEDGPGDCWALNPFSNTLKFICSSPIGSYAYLDLSAVYGQVTEYTASATQALGKTIYYNSTENTSYNTSSSIPEYDDQFLASKDWIYDGLLSKTEQYKLTTGGSYSLVRSEQNTYTDYAVSEPMTGVITMRNNIGDDFFPADLNCAVNTAATLMSWYTYFTAFNSYGIRRLTQKQVTDYTDSGNIVTTYNYTYDTTHFYLTRAQTTDSKGSTLVTVTKYPQDSATLDGLSSTAHTALDSLVGRHMLSTVLEKQQWNNGTMISRTRTNYAVFNSSTPIIEPQILQTQKLNSGLENRLEYYSYDVNGDPLSLSKDKDKNISYLWGYNNLYPFAEVSNAALSDIAATSFEFGTGAIYLDNGNTGIVSTDAVTGTNSYQINNGLAMFNLNPAKTYIVSLWAKSGTPSYNGYNGSTLVVATSSTWTTGKTINGWTYLEVSMTGVTTINVGGGGGLVDEVRFYPSTALMTTYTYQPLVGLTSTCDPGNKITYYQYDAYNRLDVVLDQDHNIIKKYCYDYAGQPSNCNGSFALNCQYNISYASWSIQLTSVLTGNVYTFSLGDYVGNTINLGTVPTGMYNVQISEVGSSGTHTIYFANYSQTGSSMSLSNVPLSSTTNINLPD